MSTPSVIERDDTVPEAMQPEPPTQKTWSIGTLTYTRTQLIILFSWLLWGDFAWSMKDRTVGPVAQLIIKKLGATDLLMSLFLVAVPAAIGIILGPVISFRSDRTRTRWGRRIPYLAVTVPFAALSMIGLGFSPAIGRALHGAFGLQGMTPNQVTLITFGLFWVVFDIATVAANAVFGALINDVVPREFLGRFYGLFRALSLIAGMIFNYKLLGLAEAHFTMLFLAVGTLYGLGVSLACLKVKEGKYPPPDDSADGQVPKGIYAAKVYARECFTHPYYIWLIATSVVAGLVFMPFNLYSLPFAQSLHIGMKTYGKYLALTYFISLCLSYALGYLADKFHPLRTGIVAMSIYALVSLWGGFYAVGADRFAIFLVVHGVLSGCYFTCTASLGQKLFPRLRFAQFASAAGLMASITNMVFAPVVGRVLDISGHNYRLTCDIGFVLGVIAVLLLTVVYRYFVKLGGMTAYEAPAS